MLKHSFSDFSYAVNDTSDKKGKKEVLVCYMYNGFEVLKKVYIDEGPGVAYVFEAKKIIDQEMRTGLLAIYSHRFIRKNKKTATAAKTDKPKASVHKAETPTPNKSNTKKWVIITAAIAVLAVVGATLTTYFVTKNNNQPEPEPQPVSDKYDVVFDVSDAKVKYEGNEKVKARAAYSCKISVVEEVANSFEINRESIVVYGGKTKLDYTLSRDEEDDDKLVLSIEAGKINGTLFVSAKSVEGISIDGDAFEFDSATGTITGFNPKYDSMLDKITEITIPDYIDDVLVENIDITGQDDYIKGNGLLTGCSSLRRLTIPFVGLNKTVTIDETDKDQRSHLLGALFGTNAFKNAETTTYQDYYYYDQDAGKELHIYKEARIPNTLKEIDITHYNQVVFYPHGGEPITTNSIPMGAFSNCTHITDIEIYDNGPAKATIGRNAFYGCRALSSVKYSYKENTNALSPIMTIEKNAFNSCGVLSSFDFSVVTEINENAFASCEGMESVYLPETVTTIKEGAFEGYYGLVKCQSSGPLSGWADGWVDPFAPVIYNTTEETNPIPDDAGRYSCLITEDPDKNKSVYIVQYLGSLDESETINITDDLVFSGESIPIKYIGAESFMDFNKTKHITVKDCLELVSLESEAFKKCLALEDITFTNCPKLTNIGSNAFETCSELVGVTLPSSVTTIGNKTFYDCVKLGLSKGEMNLANVTKVGTSAFENCASLTSIKLSSGNVTLGDSAFKNCEKLASITYGITNGVIPDYCFYNTALTSITVPTGVTAIGDYAYAQCTSAKSIVMDSNKLVSLGNNAFLRCRGVTGSVTLPSTLETIGSSAFQDCYRLVGIICNSSKITEIPDSVCYGDSELGYFLYASGAVIKKIGPYAFAQNQSLLYMGENKGSNTSDNKLSPELGEIGDRAFINCVSLGTYVSGQLYTGRQAIHIQYDSKKSPATIKMGEQVFYGWWDEGVSTNKQSNVLHISSGWITGNATKWGWSLTNVSGSFKRWNQGTGTTQNPDYLYINVIS